jgi:hypothetical protein
LKPHPLHGVWVCSCPLFMSRVKLWLTCKKPTLRLDLRLPGRRDSEHIIIHDMWSWSVWIDIPMCIIC